MCSYFVSVRQPENCRTPPPPLSQFCKKYANVPVILQYIFARYLALQRRSTADASISHIPTPRRVRKSEHLPYISYQIPTPRDHESGLMCNNFDTFLDKNQSFLRFAAIRKKLLFVSIGCSTGLKHGIFIIHCLSPWLATPLNRPSHKKLN